MVTRNWERVYLILGDAVFSHIYKEYMIFLKTRDESLVQISGTNIFCYLSDRLGRLQSAFYEGQAPEETTKPAKPTQPRTHKYNLRNETDSYVEAKKAATFNDDQVNRNRLFYCSHMNRKTRFFQKHILNDKKQTPEQVRDKLFKDIFGFTRIRASLRERVLNILEHVITAQKTFDYRYYVNKNC